MVPPSEDIKNAKKLLKKYHILLNKVYEIMRTDIPDKFYLSSAPKVHLLKMSDVNAIKKGKILSIAVIEPQSYENVSILKKNSEEITEEYFKEWQKLATTGSGDDKWIKVSENFVKWLEKLIEKMASNAKKLTSKPKKLTSKPKRTLLKGGNDNSDEEQYSLELYFKKRKEKSNNGENFDGISFFNSITFDQAILLRNEVNEHETRDTLDSIRNVQKKMYRDDLGKYVFKMFGKDLEKEYMEIHPPSLPPPPRPPSSTHSYAKPTTTTYKPREEKPKEYFVPIVEYVQYGDDKKKIYKCPECGLNTGYLVPTDPEQYKDQFPHTFICSNKGKIPREIIEQ